MTAHAHRDFGPIDDETIAVLQATALECFAQAGVDEVDVVTSQDHAGEPVILVQVKHRLVPRALDLKQIIKGDSAVRDAGWRKGERRFVYVHHQYDENQEVAASK